MAAPAHGELRANVAAQAVTALAETTPLEEIETHAERRDRLRRELRALVARASTQFAVDHKRVHATLNQRFGGPVATATLAGLEARRKLIAQWIERRVYDGMR